MTIFSFQYLPAFTKLSAFALFTVSVATPNVSIAVPPPPSSPGSALLLCESKTDRTRLCSNNPALTMMPCNPSYDDSTSGARCRGWRETAPGFWQQVDGYIVEYGAIDGACTLTTETATTSESTMQMLP